MISLYFGEYVFGKLSFSLLRFSRYRRKLVFEKRVSPEKQKRIVLLICGLHFVIYV